MSIIAFLLTKRIDDSTKTIHQKMDDFTKIIYQRMDGFKNATNWVNDKFEANIKELLEVNIKPLQNQVTNHIPTQIKSLEEKENKGFKELKANQEKMQKDINKILSAIEKKTFS